MAMTYVGKKAVQKYTKKYLSQEMQKYVGKEPGGQWVSLQDSFALHH
jgi:hypothetical protein